MMCRRTERACEENCYIYQHWKLRSWVKENSLQIILKFLFKFMKFSAFTVAKLHRQIEKQRHWTILQLFLLGILNHVFASVKNHVYIPITNEIYSTSMTKALPNSFHDDLTMYTMSSICQTIQVYLSALNLISGLRMSSWLWINRISKLVDLGSWPALL